MGSRVRHRVFWGGMGVAICAALGLVILVARGSLANALIFALFLLLLVLPLAALRPSSARRHPGRRTDPDAVEAIRAAHRPGPGARLLSLLRVVALVLGAFLLPCVGLWVLDATFGTPWFWIACLLLPAAFTFLAWRLLYERPGKMRSLGPRTSGRLRDLQRKEITNPKVHSKWEV